MPYRKSVTVTERVLLVWCLKDNRINRLQKMCDSYWEGAVGLMFKRQQNESAYDKILTITESILLIWCLKFNRINRLTVNV